MLKIMGHRGAKAYEPENTLRSIRRALQMGVEAVEIDVHLSRDGQLVVIHDATVDRTTDGSGRVADLTWAELRRLDAGLGETLPSLAEVVALVRGRAHLFVELKDPKATAPLAAFFARHDLFDEAHAISFWHPALKELRLLEPRLRTGVLFVGCPVDPAALARNAGAEVLVLNYQYVNQPLVHLARQAGLQVAVWNIDTVADLLPLLPLEVDYIGSNAPDILLNYLRQQA
ncbi:MAG: glycerophosphodiester phosphodiesterase [Desulfobacca sp.]|uniref:glycerophosphodiester phosphodiesterase n=1 Tax=Desulfobacca sp. TaxID=2067990 RepID=UPI00404A3134